MTEAMTDLAPAMAPVPYRVLTRMEENADSVTLRLEPVRGALAAPAPGEFNMIYAFGVGEVAISVSGDPFCTDGTITHTIRAVGAVSAALCAAEPGSTLGLRGPSAPAGVCRRPPAAISSSSPAGSAWPHFGRWYWVLSPSGSGTVG